MQTPFIQIFGVLSLGAVTLICLTGVAVTIAWMDKDSLFVQWKRIWAPLMFLLGAVLSASAAIYLTGIKS